jgi:hypothetical protein
VLTSRCPLAVRSAHHGGALGADVDLLAPVDAPLRELTPGPGVAPELRTARHLDRELVLLGQREEVLGLGEGAIDDLVRDPVPDQCEEADLVRRPQQVRAEGSCRLSARVEAGQVEHGEGRGNHRASLSRRFVGGQHVRAEMRRHDSMEPDTTVESRSGAA